MARSTRGAARSAAARCTAFLTMLAALTASARAQGSVAAYLALRGTAQGTFRGNTTLPAHTNDIAAIALTMSQPYGAATPVLHVVTDAAVAPQIVRALLAHEMLVAPAIAFVKPGPGGAQVMYQIKAPRGFVTRAAISAATNRVPTLTFDLLLSGGTTYLGEGGSATTAPPPSVVGSAPALRGIVLTGEFEGSRSGAFPPSPGAPAHRGILLDSIAIAMTVPVANGATSGKALVHPLNIERPAGEDAALFDAAQASRETFTKIVLHVYEPQLGGALVDGLDISTQGACMFDGSTACAPSSGMASSAPGMSAGLAGSSGHSVLPTARPVFQRLKDASTTMHFSVPTITLQSRQTQTTVTYSVTQAALQ